ncbi:SusC/RagA family TonB-linked outer membrane protein [Zunongwangia sp. H14]|uniref:SusC/RagA family TonB-linked outer membrane protein n=1 Tax=Zunongwangia sp. H14 TaxID=3240792 RepID=UPI0035629342
MKNNYKRWKFLAWIIVGIIIYILAVPAHAAVLTTNHTPQQQQITGTVTGENNLPLPGVTVSVKGEARGTVTSFEGEYSITAGQGETLVFSFLGYKKQEIAVGSQTEINVQLEEDVDALDAVKINAGYYNTTRRESTGNISRVTAEEIENQPVVSPIQALQGRMAGVEVVSGGSNPGTAPTIRIRGTNSLREEGNYPLYIIDGVPINSTPVETNSIIGDAGLDPLNNLNLSNIESIEVLKDADATAIYGSRGANGVVLITTKSGKTKGTALEARFFTGAATVPNRLDLLDTEQYLAVRRRAFENDGVEQTERNAYDLLLWDQDRFTDWQDFLFGGTAGTTSADLNFSGGNGNTFFRVGGSYFTQGTVYPGDYDYDKMTGHLNFNHNSEDNKLDLSLSVNYGVDVNNLVGNLNLNSSISRLPPNAPSIFNEEGSLNWEDWALAGLDNPMEGFYNFSETQTNNLISNLNIAYELLPGIRIKSSFGYTYYTSEETRNLPRRSYNPAENYNSSSAFLNSTRKSWIIEPQLVYNRDFHQLNVKAIIGGTFQVNKSNLLRFQGSGFASDALIGNIAAAEGIINAANITTEYRYAAVFSRIGFDWDKKYYLNFTGRRDGSSRFGPNRRFANFGAVGVAWIFSEEAFLKDSQSFLSFGKFRGSYGTTGNDQIGDYGYLDTYAPTTGSGGLYPTGLANPDYSWEINKKLEGGIELGFYENRLNISLSRYQNRSSNQLVGYALPYTTGFTSVQANLPATVENTGWEIEASGNIIQNKKLNWQASFNISFPKNELLSYPDLEQSSYANTYKIGYPLNISLRYQYNGLDPETGFYTVKDVNEDGRLDYQDRVLAVDQNRKFFGGINNNFSFKGLSLQFLWEFVKQKGDLTLFNLGTQSNALESSLSALDGEGEYQRISRSSQASNAFNNVVRSGFPIQDASFLRLKTLSLGYNLPQPFLKSIGVETCKLFVHGQNLFTVTPYEGMDPENPASGSSFRTLRTITGGVQINL